MKKLFLMLILAIPLMAQGPNIVTPHTPWKLLEGGQMQSCFDGAILTMPIGDRSVNYVCKNGEYQKQVELDDPHRVWLSKAFVSRPLTDAELVEVMQWEESIFMTPGTIYDKDTLRWKFQNALMFQLIIRQTIKSECCNVNAAK